MTSTHSAADLRGIPLANVARWDGDPSKTSHIVAFFAIENCLSIATRAARGLGTHAENWNLGWRRGLSACATEPGEDRESKQPQVALPPNSGPRPELRPEGFALPGLLRRPADPNTGMVQKEVTPQGWLGSTPEGRRPQVRGLRAGGSPAGAGSTAATQVLSPPKVLKLNHAQIHPGTDCKSDLQSVGSGYVSIRRSPYYHFRRRSRE